MLQLPPLGQASLFLFLFPPFPLCFTVIWHISCTSIYRVLVGSVHNGLNQHHPPYPLRPCAVPIPKLPRPAGALAARFVVRLKKGRAKGARRGLLGLTCTCSWVCVNWCACVCVCAAHISYFILELCEFWFAAFKQIFSKCSQPACHAPQPLFSSLSYCLCWVSFCILFAIMAALLRGRTGIWGVASA